jgi:hypothetical protein
MIDEEITIVAGLIWFFVTILVQTFYLLTLYRTILSIRPEFRKVTPAQAWLGFIPIFHLIWPFIINNRVALSIREDLDDRNLHDYSDYGKSIGTIYPALRFGGIVPFLGAICGIIYLILFIIWWAKLSQSRHKLLAAGEGRSYETELLDN